MIPALMASTFPLSIAKKSLASERKVGYDRRVSGNKRYWNIGILEYWNMEKSETGNQAIVQGSEGASDLKCRQSPVYSSLIEQILLSQPLNPLRKCEFEVMPRSAT